MDKLSKLLEVYRSRNYIAFDVGLALIISGYLALKAGQIFKIVVCRKAAKYFYALGVLVIIISFTIGSGRLGLSLSHSTNSLSNESVNQLSAEKATDLELDETQNKVASSGLLRIRINCLTIYVEDIECSNNEEFLNIFSRVYSQGANVLLVDDYADYIPYTYVRNELNQKGIHVLEKHNGST